MPLGNCLDQGPFWLLAIAARIFDEAAAAKRLGMSAFSIGTLGADDFVCDYFVCD
jgi:hypothetical protein